MEKISPPAVRYIKLGPNGRWWKSARDNNRLELGHAAISHALATAGDWAAVRAVYAGHPKAGVFTQELQDFTELPAGGLWVTFAEGRLWWALAGEGTVWLDDGDGESHGARARPLQTRWRDTDLAGAPLLVDELHGGLTQTAGYRMSVCRVREEAYLLRRINAEHEPAVTAALAARRALLGAIEGLIQRLHERDFELLVDLIFARSGWRRVSVLGGVEADIDLIVTQPVTGERIFVQVKSRAKPPVLSRYMDLYRARTDCARMIFACHTPEGKWPATHDDDIQIWCGEKLAAQALDAGLMDWLVQRAR